MPEQASFAFYRIDECGYFAPGNHQPLFGDGVDTVRDLAQWLAQGPKSVEETATFEVEDDADLNKVYCLGINGALHDPDFLLTTWNETPSVDGRTASVQRASRVGAPSVDLTDIPNGGIPGYATYFWIVPAHHLLATVRFQHPHNGHVGFCEYMRGFLARHSPHTVYNDPDPNGDLEILGYRRDRHSQIQDLRPAFRSYPVRRRGQLDLIRQYRPSIRKIIRKSTMQVVGQDDRAIFQGVMTAIGLRNRHVPPHDIKFKSEIAYTPTDADLERIIRTWEEHHEAQWDDVGFAVTGMSETFWLSHSLARTQREMDVRRVNAELIDGRSLLSQIRDIREELLALAD